MDRHHLLHYEYSQFTVTLAKLLNNPARSDVTFMVQGMPIYAHRCVIMCRCDPLDNQPNICTPK